MDYIECERIQNAGYCADNDCNCSLTPLPQGGGYLYISEEVVEFRKDALSLAEVQEKLGRLTCDGEYISINKYAPILVCEISAFRRNLDLAVAKEDAKMFWREGKVPLRATPLAINEEPVFPDSDLQDQHGDPGLNAENGNEGVAEVPNISDTKAPRQIRDGSDDTNAGRSAPVLRDVSVDEVLDQFSSGPLAELAKKMAQGMGNANSCENSTAGIIPETVITSGTGLRPMDQEYDGKAGGSLQKKRIVSKTIKPQKSKPLVTRPALVTILTIAGIVLGISGFSTAAALIIVKLRKPKPVSVVTQPSGEVVTESPVELTRSFFEREYLFVDEHCKGTMSFTLADDFGGEYIQSVNLKGNDKTYRVHGIYSYTVNSITYRPDSYSKDIVWILDEYDQDGNAAFYDPSEKDSKAARVYLRVKN